MNIFKKIWPDITIGATALTTAFAGPIQAWLGHHPAATAALGFIAFILGRLHISAVNSNS